MKNVIRATFNDGLVQSSHIILHPYLSLHYSHLHLFQKILLILYFCAYLVCNMFQPSNLGMKTGDLVLQVEGINSQLDLVGPRYCPCAKPIS